MITEIILRTIIILWERNNNWNYCYAWTEMEIMCCHHVHRPIK